MSDFGEHLSKGVYVDVSGCEGKGFILGFVFLKQGAHFRWSTSGIETRHPNLAEAEAVNIAKKLYPLQDIYCDNYDTAIKEGVYYIKRSDNAPAHRTARFRKNFINRPRLDALLSEGTDAARLDKLMGFTL